MEVISFLIKPRKINVVEPIRFLIIALIVWNILLTIATAYTLHKTLQYRNLGLIYANNLEYVELMDSLDQ